MRDKEIYVVCPDRNEPLGGVKQLYQLVDILNAIGYKAYILHKKKNFRVTWYANQTPIVNYAGIFKKLTWYRKSPILRLLETILFGKKVPKKNSILVFPEVYGPNINLFKEYQIVIFNQNCYYSFEQFPFCKPSISPYSTNNLLGCIVVSEDSKKYLSLYKPNIKVERIRIGLSQVFTYGKEKKKQIAFMPRKLSEDANQIYQFIIYKDYFKDWEFVAIDGLPEQEVANVLQQSAIFLSFNHREGFGLPPAEAMACGCYVIGYGGNAGNEYFKPEFSTLIEARNILNFVTELEKIIIQHNDNPEETIRKGELASKYILSTYNKINEQADVEVAWNNIINN